MNEDDAHALLDHALECLDYHQRADMLLNLLTEAPNYGEAYMELGKCYIRNGQYENAVTVLKKSISLDDDGWARIWLGHVYYMHLSEFRRAETEYRRAIKIMPSIGTPRWTLAELLKDEGKLEESEELFRAAIELEPDCADSHARLARFLVRRGRRDDASVSLQRALALDAKCKLALRIIEEYGFAE